jgi:hypothetical protein
LAEAAVLVPMAQWRQLQAAAQPSLKQLLMEEGSGEILILPRGKGRSRSPEAF